eukprot:615588-Amphidinium_carterae.1
MQQAAVSQLLSKAALGRAGGNPWGLARGEQGTCYKVGAQHVHNMICVLMSGTLSGSTKLEAGSKNVACAGCVHNGKTDSQRSQRLLSMCAYSTRRVVLLWRVYKPQDRSITERACGGNTSCCASLKNAQPTVSLRLKECCKE